MNAHYDAFRNFLQNSCGIVLGDNKQYLVNSRLGRLMQDSGIKDLGELVERMQRGASASLKQSVIDAMTTNETLWFRDAHPFAILKDRLLPEFQKQMRGGPVRIWSAACSTGQEPYSISMIVEEYKRAAMGVLKYPVDIVATDLARSVLELARKGEYDELSLGRGMSPERLRLYFDATANNIWSVKSFVRQRVRFAPLNLMENYSSLGKFDVVFLRNVLIYFSADMKLDILRRVHKCINPGGYLIIGASEGMNGVAELYDMVQCNPGIIYARK